MAAVADVDPFVRVVPAPVTAPPKRRRRTFLGDFNQLLGLDGVVPLTSGDIPDGSEAVLYLRVSTARQMNTAIDIDEDGNSIATQREVGTKRCRRLNAPIAREFVEPGNSAQSIAKRVLAAMGVKLVSCQGRVR